MAQSIHVPREFSVEIPPAGIAGDLAIPQNARGLVLFAHGSGSSRFSSRNRHVAAVLREAGLATLLLDMLTPTEDEVDRQTHHLRFDIGLLTERLSQATRHLAALSETSALPTGYFGASTGAAAALVSAPELSGHVRAIVSRGGRPDLAQTVLTHVRAPTLLIVGGNDETVVRLNREALEKLSCEKKLEIVPGATHLFEEPGVLDRVAALANRWFQRYLT